MEAGAAGAKNNADLVAVVALKAMIKSGKFAGSSDNAHAVVKKAVEGAAISAVTYSNYSNKKHY
ncbi:variable large family protein [Borrelia venezuelensis]|uniref:variable large family protein n=1 Tax=Borrelia venezuelensis TaxID=1653839 RepID=UPI003D9B5260